MTGTANSTDPAAHSQAVLACVRRAAGGDGAGAAGALGEVPHAESIALLVRTVVVLATVVARATGTSVERVLDHVEAHL